MQDAHESDLDSLLDGTGTVVGESLDVSLPGPSQQCTQSTSPPEWEDIPPDVVIKRLKAIPPDVTSSLRIRDFYKSYPSWEKMTQEQKNKAVAWYRTLPHDIQGKFLFGIA